MSLCHFFHAFDTEKAPEVHGFHSPDVFGFFCGRASLENFAKDLPADGLQDSTGTFCVKGFSGISKRLRKGPYRDEGRGSRITS